mmetsp:Transcript_492/g.809  ORF Transcript_492/g.809 Transcript_492/m.809 type:complete len:205 (+) Transcript_492:869-1483(+)
MLRISSSSSSRTPCCCCNGKGGSMTLKSFCFDFLSSNSSPDHEQTSQNNKKTQPNGSIVSTPSPHKGPVASFARCCCWWWYRATVVVVVIVIVVQFFGMQTSIGMSCYPTPQIRFIVHVETQRCNSCRHAKDDWNTMKEGFVSFLNARFGDIVLNDENVIKAEHGIVDRQYNAELDEEALHFARGNRADGANDIFGASGHGPCC